MTRYLKLVRHNDGNWKALTTECDDIAEIPVKEKLSAPIDPIQLLKALDSLLSPDGGIRSVEDVPRLASLMKKFSKKLVSRCVYCNVLQATAPEILSEYLDKGGWETINVWLQYAKTSESNCFMIEMLKLCKQLPMTVERLKENNTAKLVKSFTKHEHSDIKTLSAELVSNWMAIIKDKKPEAPKATVEKKKKKEKEKVKAEKAKTHVSKKEETETAAVSIVPEKKAEVEKTPFKLRGTKRSSSEKETKKEFYEDVKIDPEPLMPISKKSRTDRPKTAKIYQKKFRATGLLEETPLPKNMQKKSTPTDKSAAVAAAKNVLKLNTSLSERIVEKKIKPESLMVVNESTSNKGVKLIPPKPKPIHVLHESASFMDALTSQPVAPVKRKKKVPTKAANSPTSPTMTPPKLQFYKETLEMDVEQNPKKEENEKENVSADPEKQESEEKGDSNDKADPEAMDATAEDGETTPLQPDADSPVSTADSQETEVKKETVKNATPDKKHKHSILSHGRRRGRKKSVKWVEDENLKEIFYFEMDETERENVLRTQNFGDLKSLDSRREREAFEQAKRHAGDKMEEFARWWITPIIIDCPAALVEFGYQSRQKELEKVRQEGTLQEIYFTKEMIPDSPHEPDLEIVPPQDPVTIPTDEGNGAVMDYSKYEIPKPVLPDVLSSLIKLNGGLPLPPEMSSQAGVPDQILSENGSMNHVPEMMNPQNMPMSVALSPYDPAEPLPVMPPNNLMGPPPPGMHNMYSPPILPEHMPNMPPPNDWMGMEAMQQEQHYYHNFGGMNGPPMMNEPVHNMNMNMRPRMMHDLFRPNHHRGGPHPGNRGGPRGRIICRHFMTGRCRFEAKCTFRHPGVNSPDL